MSGWKRIGVIASVVWILGSGSLTYELVQYSVRQSFIAGVGRKEFDQNPNSEAWANSLARAWTVPALERSAWVAFGGVPVGWGLAYLILFLVKWVRRGFAVPTPK